MTDHLTRQIVAVLMVAGFFGVVITVLIFVDVSDPAIAKFAGAALGYLSGLLSTIIFRYFGSPPASEAE